MLDEHLKFPTWQEPLRDLILEGDPDKLSEKFAEVERLISDRASSYGKMETESSSEMPSMTLFVFSEQLSVIREDLLTINKPIKKAADGW